MNEAYSKQAQQSSYSGNSILDSLFDTRRIVNIAICASATGMLILLALTYLLRGVAAVLHIAILAVLMMLLLIALIIYKSMILNDPSTNYDAVQMHQNQQTENMAPSAAELHNKEKDNNKQNNSDNSSQSSSFIEVQVLPKGNQTITKNVEMKAPAESQPDKDSKQL